jgi:hypothetical protein
MVECKGIFGSDTLNVDDREVFQIVKPDKKFGGQMMKLIFFGKSQRLSHIATNTLPKCAVPSFNMSSVTSFFTNGLVFTRIEDFLISFPKVTKRGTFPIRIGNSKKKLFTAFLTSVSDEKSNYLTGSPAKGNPQPAFFLFFTYKTAQFIQFDNIISITLCYTLSKIRQAFGKLGNEHQQGFKRYFEDTCDTPQTATFSKSTVQLLYFLQTTGFTNGIEYLRFVAVMAKTSLRAIGCMPIFDNICTTTSWAAMYNCGNKHSSEIG